MPSPIAKAFLETTGGSDAIRLMISDPSARASTVPEELVREANAAGTNPAAASRFIEIAAFVREVLALAEAFATVGDFDALVSWYASSPRTLLSDFAELIATFAADAARNKNTPLNDALRRGMAQRIRLVRLLRTMNRAFADDTEPLTTWVKRFPRLANPTFHRWLELAADGSLESNPKASASYRHARELLVYTCRVIAATEAALNAQPDARGRITIRMPKPPADAEFWHNSDPRLTDHFLPLAQRLADGESSLAQAMVEASALVAPEAIPGERAHVLSVFLEHALRRVKPPVAADLLVEYRNLLELPTADDARIHGTLTLHYGIAVLKHFRVLPTFLPVLEDAVDCIGRSISVTSEQTAPRLLRDLYFTRARLQENIGSWRPDRFEAAAADFQAGLNVNDMTHENEARGRALGDLGNVLRHLDIDETRDAKLLAIYDEALACLPKGKSYFPRAIVLNNYATYFQERPFGDYIQNQERALTLINDAIPLLDNVLQNDDDQVAIARSALASAHMARGNILRSRVFTRAEKPYEHIDEAMNSYHAGLGALGTIPHENQGFLRLNMAFGYLDQYRIKEPKDIAYVQRAERSLQEAEEKFAEWPRLAALARLERALLVFHEDDVEDQRMSDVISDALNAAKELETHGMPHEAANAHLALGRLLEHQAGVHDTSGLLRPIQHYTEAYRRFLKMGDTLEAIRAARATARVAVALYRKVADKERLREARAMLAQAAKLVEQLLTRFDTIEWRTQIAFRFSAIYSDLLWCQAELGEPSTLLWESACRAKGRELLSHVSWLGRKATLALEEFERVDALRLEAHRVQITSSSSRAPADPGTSLWENLNSSNENVQRLFDRMRLLGWNDVVPSGYEIEGRLRAIDLASPGTIVMDINVSQWGTVVLLHMPKGDFAVNIPLHRQRLEELLWGPDGWCTSYATYRRAGPQDKLEQRQSFHEATERLIDAISAELLSPAFKDWMDEVSRARLLIVPGALAGLPIHAAKMPSTSNTLFEIVRGLAYVPTAAMLAPIAIPRAPQKVLCILSTPHTTPEGQPVTQLKEAPAEVAEVATRFAERGADVTTVASAGPDLGAAVFASHGLTLPPEVRILEERPTPELLTKILPDYDFIFYSGHGFSSGLLLVNEAGQRKDLDTQDLLTMQELRRAPIFHLSACETAYEDNAGVGEVFSFVSGLLRRGASFVVGGMWFVFEQRARAFAHAFHDELFSASQEPDVALCDALRALKNKAESEGENATFSWAPFAGFIGA